MLIKSQSPIHPPSGIITNLNRIRYRSPSQRNRNSPKAVKSRKRSSPKINRSFAVYEESSPSASRFRSTSADRPRNNSIGDMKSIRSRHTTLKSVTKISEILEIHDVQLELGKNAIKDKKYSQAIEIFNTVLQKDRSNLDAMYSRAVSYMHLQEHKLALPDFLSIVKENPVYDKQLYTATAMCFVAMSDVPTALRLISKGLQKFPRFSEGLVVRGQLYLKQDK